LEDKKDEKKEDKEADDLKKERSGDEDPEVNDKKK